jgi:hypothetical protein
MMSRWKRLFIAGLVSALIFVGSRCVSFAHT